MQKGSWFSLSEAAFHFTHIIMEKDVIIIVRHGKPALSRSVWLTWKDFRQWWKAYDVGGLAEAQKIPRKLQALAETADLVISSPLRRAVESARLLIGRDPDLIDEDLIEAALPPPHLGNFKFRPKAWGTFARVAWFVGWSDGMESHKNARIRANKMAAKLAKHAEGGKTVLVTAHGWYNRMLKGSLMDMGWKCVSQNGDLHWSHRQFERIVKEK